MDTVLQVAQGSFQLQRLPLRKQELLRAWDAADEYVLNYLAEQGLPQRHARVLIVNDSFGALAVALHAFQPVALSDSYLSQQATRINLAANQIDSDSIRLLDSLAQPEQVWDYVLIKVPKTLALLEFQLHQLRPWLKPETQIIAAGMVKNLTPNVWKLFEKIIGPTTSSLAVKKARLIVARLDPLLTIPANPYPTRFKLEGTGLLICNHANVFSRESLDIGTRFLLQHLPAVAAAQTVIDLGCGNGIVGVSVAGNTADAKVIFVDESFMALASARENFARACPGASAAEFIAADCLTGMAAASADYIICNPPFHQQHSVGDQIAWQMFRQSLQVLRPGGELRVIGNRHLNYHVSLKKLFGNCQQIASNAKFVIFSCKKRN